MAKKVPAKVSKVEEPRERVFRFKVISQARGWNLTGEIRGTFAPGEEQRLRPILMAQLQGVGFRIEEIT